MQTAESLATGSLLHPSRHLTADVFVSSLGFSVFCPLVHNKAPFLFPVPFVHDFLFIAQQPPLDQGLFIIEASLSHSDTPRSVELLSTSDQPDAETSPSDNTQHSLHASGGNRTHNPINRETAYTLLRPPGRWDLLVIRDWQQKLSTFNTMHGLR